MIEGKIFVPAKGTRYTEGNNSVGCPNRKRCGESSLSLRWAIGASQVAFMDKPATFPVLTCFICGTTLGEMKDADE